MRTYNQIGIYFSVIGVAILALAVMLDGCSKYDDTPIRNELNELEMIVEKLDDWCENTNSQIRALQGLAHALENNDHITDVVPIMQGSKEIGYTIFFNERSPIRILNVEDGKDGIAPQIEMKKGSDGKNYWTVQIGAGPVEFILDDVGQKVLVTGEDGASGGAATSPTINVAAYYGDNANFTGMLCWKINGRFVPVDGNPVVAAGVYGSPGATSATGATGAQGDAIFKENGISLDRVNGTVTFTLADGTSTISLPLASNLTVSIVGGNGTKIISQSSHQFTINGTDSYAAIKAEITSGSGVVSDVGVSRTSTSSSPWGVKIGAKVDGADNTWSSTVTVNRYAVSAAEYLSSREAILKITIIDNKGKEVSTSCPLQTLTVTIAAGQSLEATINALAPLMIEDIKFIKINGLLSGADFTGYLRPHFSGLVLDLSDARVENNQIPSHALYMNSIVQCIILPKNVSIGSQALSRCSSLLSVDISGVTAIGPQAFAYTALSSIDIPSAVTTIGDYTFMSATNLTSVNIPKVTEIGTEAFRGCTSLSSISMPKVTNINKIAFMGCSSLPEISFYALTSLTNIDNTAFTSSGIRTIKVYNSGYTVIAAFNTWLDTNFPLATAVVGN